MKLERIGPGDWAYCLSQLGGKTLADGRAVMRDRIKKGKKSNEHVNRGTWLAENTNVVDRVILMARREYNPLIFYPEQAVQANKSGKDLFLRDNVLLYKRPAAQVLSEIAEQDKYKPLTKRRVFIPSKREAYSVPCDGFGDDDVISWLAQGRKSASDYGKFLLNDFEINNVTVYLPDTNLGNISRCNWLYGLGGSGRSYFFCCDGRFLVNGNGSVFGVDFSAEGTTRKISRKEVRILSPSLRDVLKFSKIYVPEVARKEYESGIRSLFDNK